MIWWILLLVMLLLLLLLLVLVFVIREILEPLILFDPVSIHHPPWCNIWSVLPSKGILYEVNFISYRNQPRILLVHGNGGSVAELGDLAMLLKESGFLVLLLEYRGFGASTYSRFPRPSDLIKDLQEAWNVVSNPEQVIVLGFSFGGAVVTEFLKKIKTEEMPKQVVLLNTFAYFPEVAWKHLNTNYPHIPLWIKKFLLSVMKTKWHSKQGLQRYLKNPKKNSVVIVSSRQDEVIPSNQSQLLANWTTNNNSHYVILENTSHTPIWDKTNTYWFRYLISDQY